MLFSSIVQSKMYRWNKTCIESPWKNAARGKHTELPYRRHKLSRTCHEKQGKFYVVTLQCNTKQALLVHGWTNTLHKKGNGFFLPFVFTFHTHLVSVCSPTPSTREHQQQDNFPFALHFNAGLQSDIKREHHRHHILDPLKSLALKVHHQLPSRKRRKLHNFYKTTCVCV